MKWIVAFVACCWISAPGFGQDHLVMNTGDTLRGKTKFMTYDQLDRVQILQEKKKLTLTARDVRSVYHEGKMYQPVPLDNMIRFMEVEKSGYLSLMMVREGTQLPNGGGRFLLKRDGKLLDVPNLTFKKTMAEFVSDVPEVEEKIKAGTYTRRDLHKIIDEYNMAINNVTADNRAKTVLTQKAVEKIVPVQKLRKAVAEAPAFDGQKDALDLLDDIAAKVTAHQNVPNYMLDALTKSLAGVPAVQADLEEVTTSLR